MLCIAAGHTSVGIFERLVESYNQKKLDFSSAHFVAMDEWTGMSEKTPNSCGEFLSRCFFSKVNFKPGNIKLFDGAASSPDEECLAVQKFIKENSSDGVIDFLVLGTGMNGHLALNEPGCDFELSCGVVPLDDITKQVAQKYFDTKQELLSGLTLGVAEFKKAKRSVLMVSGAHKREILHKILSEPISNKIPATAVRDFVNASIYCDRETYGG